MVLGRPPPATGHNGPMTLQTLLADPSAVGNWKLVGDQSSIRFGSKTLWGLVPVKGRFTEVTGSGKVNADGTVSGRLDIKAASLTTGIGMRDKHLRSEDFFDTDNFPDITVEVTGPQTATLSIRGTTLPLPVRFTVTRPDANTLQIAAHAEIDRTKWGVSGNMAGMMPSTTTLVGETVFTRS